MIPSIIGNKQLGHCTSLPRHFLSPTFVRHRRHEVQMERPLYGW